MVGDMKTHGAKICTSRTMPLPDAKTLVGGEDASLKAMWDEEFFGHELPPNYRISRARTPDGSEKRTGCDGKKGERAMWDEEFLGHRLPPHYVISRLRTPEGLEKRRGPKASLADEQHRHSAEDALEYGFEKTVDSYVLSEQMSCCDWVVDPGSTFRKDSKSETFEERALRFGVEDWNLVDKKWTENEVKCRKRSARRGIFHSPSGSDSSSLVSTLESSSFTCGSEASSFTKTDYSASSFNLSYVPGCTLPVSASHQPPPFGGERTISEEQFVELAIFEGGEADAGHVQAQQGRETGDGAYLEFDFLEDGKMVESEDFDVKDGRAIKDNSPGRGTGSGRTNYQSATFQSPESENLFDSDWSGTHSALDQCPAGARDFDEDDASNCSEAQDWISDTHIDDADEAPIPPTSNSRSDAVLDGEEKVAVAGNPKLPIAPAPPSRTLKKIQAPSRKTRSLGSVLSHHLAFTAASSTRSKAQPSFTAPADQKESPAKVTAACIDWLWSEKGSLKPVQALRALAESENAERDRIGTSPNSNLRARVPRPSGLGRPQQQQQQQQQAINRDPAKESRDSIIASWAAVSGAGEFGERTKRPSRSSTSSCVKQGGSRGGASPRRRSVSFGGHSGSKAVAKSAPKNLAVELEVLCRPFGPVRKGVRFLPSSAKRGLGRPPLFSSFASTSSSTNLSPVLKWGRLQCVVSRDGSPSYSLIMDEPEEIFIAKTPRVDALVQEGLSHMYTFHSYKGKGKGGWRLWGRKEKSSSDFAGNMTVTSTICPDGVQSFIESEFVLFDATVKEISISGPTSTSPYPRSSFSSWDTMTPQRSPQGQSSSTHSSPTSTYYSLPSPTPPAGLFSTPGHGAGRLPSATVPPSRYVSLSMPPAVTLRGTTSLDKGVSRLKLLERHMSLASPLNSNLKAGNGGVHESMSDSETVDEYESRSWCFPHSHSEMAAVVIRTPLEGKQGKSAGVGDKWGWGINFLRKSFNSPKSSPEPQLSAGGDGPGTCEEARGSSKDQRCGTCGSPSLDDQSNGGLSVTLILPTGEHGCVANGIDGPQPLVERWRSGGKCDCGSWDLGCGLSIVGNENNVDASVPEAQTRDRALRLYLQGRKHQTVGLTLTPLREGCYSLGFQAPISSLHAFATAVAVLHSRDPIIPARKGDSKRRIAGISVIQASARPSTRHYQDEAPRSKSLASYSYDKLIRPDPPSSPFGRA